MARKRHGFYFLFFLNKAQAQAVQGTGRKRKKGGTRPQARRAVMSH